MRLIDYRPKMVKFYYNFFFVIVSLDKLEPRCMRVLSVVSISYSLKDFRPKKSCDFRLLDCFILLIRMSNA